MTKRITLAAGVLLCAQALTVQAAELKYLPADTKWVLNLDMKAAQASPILNDLANTIAPAKRQKAQAKLAAVKALFGVDLLKDIDSLVIAGNGNAQNGGVAYVYAKLDAERLATILAINSTSEGQAISVSTSSATAIPCSACGKLRSAAANPHNPNRRVDPAQRPSVAPISRGRFSDSRAPRIRMTPCRPKPARGLKKAATAMRAMKCP